MDTVIRIVIFYVAILVGMRVLGKREFAQMSPLELVTLLLIPEIVSQSLVTEDFSIVNGLIGLGTLFSLVFINSTLMHRYKKFESAVSGKPSLLVYRGRFIEEAMNKERVTPDEVYAAMRMFGLEDLAQVKWAILEADGRIAIIPENPDDPVKRPSLEY
ncbi:MAG TPA: YetF domain-containing protein [Gammaproteobacteria bacterium]|jgi:uncharacterized membrane protein YcaP (DUF421 family)